MTRRERSARNKRAHAIRRQLVDADYRDARARGERVSWRDIAAMYDAMSADMVLDAFGDTLGADVSAGGRASRSPRDAAAAGAGSSSGRARPAAADSRPTPNVTSKRGKRSAPAHVAYARDLFREARAARDALRESCEPLPSHVAVRVPGVGDSSVSWAQLDDETFAAVYPAPVFKDILKQVCADMREQKATLLVDA